MDAQTTVAQDGDEWVEEVEGDDGTVSIVHWDAMDRVTRIETGDGEWAEVSYNEGGEPARVVTSLGELRQLEWLDHRFVSVADEHGLRGWVLRDGPGREIRFENRDGAWLVWEFTEGDRWTSYADSLGGRRRAEFDSEGRCTYMESEIGCVWYTYDDARQTVTIADSDGEQPETMSFAEWCPARGTAEDPDWIFSRAGVEHLIRVLVYDQFPWLEA